MNLLSEFQGRGYINRVAIKYAGWLFLAMYSAALTYAYKHENFLELYIKTHVTQHIDEHDHIDGKLDDIMDQININFTAIEVIKMDIKYLKERR